MRDFFKPWRRKVGCVALVMACVFAAGWMRSLLAMDTATSVIGTFMSVIYSTDGMLVIAFGNPVAINTDPFPSIADPTANPSMETRWLSVESYIFQPFRYDDFSDPSEPWDWNVAGARFDWRPQDEVLPSAAAIPYWSIILPLTLLSAYLLLNKRRSAKTHEPTLPPEVDHA